MLENTSPSVYELEKGSPKIANQTRLNRRLKPN